MFFYRFIIHFFRVFETSILSTEEAPNISDLIKESQQKTGFGKFLSEIPFFNNIFNKNIWTQLIEDCKTEVLDEASIKDLLSRYDVINKRLKYIRK